MSIVNLVNAWQGRWGGDSAPPPSIIIWSVIVILWQIKAYMIQSIKDRFIILVCSVSHNLSQV